MSTATGAPVRWPTAGEFVEAIQAPSICFPDPDLKRGQPALDRNGMPVVSSGNFAYVFKLNVNGASSEAIRCFRGESADRGRRYQCIEERLDAVTTPCLVDFEYEPQGILVAGKRYPIIVMEWIQGNSLDVYVASVLQKHDVLRFLAESWLRVLASLRAAGIAHGDLQHGNVIVDSANALRLVDVDGMFVPAMTNWRATELGHCDYQHPKRAAEYFDGTLDNFAGLVIYVSLVALAADPTLWDKYHDDNLIFCKKDFENPQSSELFARARRLGGDCARLADVLERACRDDPRRCPLVLDLTTVSATTLPTWMRAPAVAVPGFSREAGHRTAPPAAPVPAAAAGSQAVPWWQGAARVQSAASAQGAPTPIASFAQTTSVAALVVAVPPGRPSLESATARHTINYAFVGGWCAVVWFPASCSMLTGIGMPTAEARLITCVLFLLTCSLLGVSRAYRESRVVPVGSTPATSATAASALWGATAQVPVAPSPARPVVTPPATVRPLTVSVTNIVGSRIRLIYHTPRCRWAQKISSRNRIGFGSARDAIASGYRPCRECRP